MSETPEQVVTSAVASAALDGRDVSPEWQEVLLQVADGSLSADEAVRVAVAEASGVSGQQPTAENPWTVTLHLAGDQEGGRVTVAPTRVPVVAVWSRIEAGENPSVVADDYGLPRDAVRLLERLRQQTVEDWDG